MLKNKILQYACEKHKLMAFRTEKEEWGETIVGHVKEINKDNITIGEVDEYGIPIGTSTFKLDAILDIILEDKTLNSLEILEGLHAQLVQKDCTTFWGCGNEIKEHISERMHEKKPTTIFVNDGDNDDTDIIGFILEMDEKCILVEMIDRYGEKDGVILIPLETITGVRWDSLEDNARWLLFQRKKHVKDSLD